jgi:hypothetical protein
MQHQQRITAAHFLIAQLSRIDRERWHARWMVARDARLDKLSIRAHN